MAHNTSRAILMAAVGFLAFSGSPPIAQPLEGTDRDADIPELTGVNEGWGHRVDEEAPLPAGRPQPPFHDGEEGPVLFPWGAAWMKATDCVLPGIDDGLAFERCHISGVDFSGQSAADRFLPKSPFGKSWGSSLASALTETAQGVVLGDCDRLDLFVPSGTGAWRCPGRFDLLFWKSGTGQFWLVSPGMWISKYTVVSEGGFRVGRLSEQVSPNGNRIRIGYEQTGTAKDWRIAWVEDAYGRRVTLHGGAEGRTVRIEDYTGRSWTYDYDARSRLKTVTRPDGKKTRYVYLSEADPGAPPEMADFLAAVIEPNQTADGTLLPARRWHYRTDPAAHDHRRVVRYTEGNRSPEAAALGIDAGGDYAISYHAIDATTPAYRDVAGTANAPAILARVVDPRGFATESLRNARGYPLEETRFGHQARWTRTWARNEDDLVVRHQRETTEAVRYVYDADSPIRLNHGDLRRVISTPDDRGAAQAEITRDYVTDPIFGGVYKETDARGQVTTHYPAWLENRPAAVSTFAPLLGVSPPALEALLDERGMADQPDLNGDARWHQMTGNVVKTVHPTATRPSEAEEFRIVESLQRTDAETWTYNDYGQPLRHVDAAGVETEWRYFPKADPDGDGLEGGNPVANDGKGGGYLTETRLPGDPASQPDDIVEEYFYEGDAGRRGNVTKERDPRGVETHYRHDAMDRPTEETSAAVVAPEPRRDPLMSGGPLGYRTQADYDANGDPVVLREERVDPENGIPAGTWVVHEVRRDILGQPIELVEDATGIRRTTRIAFDGNGNPVERIEASGSAEEAGTQAVWSARDLLVGVREGVGTPRERSEWLDRDCAGNVVRMTDPLGRLTAIRRDGYGRLAEATDPAGTRHEMDLDAAGNVLEIRAFGPAAPGAEPSLLKRASFLYDELGREIVRHHGLFLPRDVAGIVLRDGGSAGGNIRPGDGQVSAVRVYGAAGRLLAAIDDGEKVSLFAYDRQGRLSMERDPVGNSLLHDYDRGSNVTRTRYRHVGSPAWVLTSAEEADSRYRYDALGRLTEEIHGGLSRQVHSHDSFGNVTLTQADDGARSRFSYDALGRPASQTGWPLFPETTVTRRWQWSLRDNLTAETDGNGNSIRTFHDVHDNVERIAYADGTTETFAYNPDDTLQEHIDQNGTRVRLAYDAGGRLAQVDATPAAGVAGPSRETYGYDGLGRTVSCVTGGVRNDLYRDSLGRLVEERQTVEGIPFSVKREYTGPWCTRMIYPDSWTVDLTRDALGRILTVSDAARTYVQVGYAGPSAVYLGNANGTKQDNRYGGQTFLPGSDPLKRESRWKTPAGADLMRLTRTFDRDGKLLREDDSVLSRSDRYAYDGMERLTEHLDQATPARWRLDAAGNWTEHEVGGEDRRPVADPVRNDLSGFDGRVLAQDVNGNLTDDGRRRYAYDFRNRLTEVRDRATGELIAAYAYDAFNRRVAKWTEGGRTRCIYDEWKVVEERDGTEQAQRQYLELDGAADFHLAMRARGAGGDPVMHYYHADPAWSVRAVTNEQGEATHRIRYGAYGEPTFLAADGQSALPRDPSGNPYAFQGRRYDPETGFYEYRMRMYDPVTGRFLSRDDAERRSLGGILDDGMRFTASGLLEIPPDAYYRPRGNSMTPDVATWGNGKTPFANAPSTHIDPLGTSDIRGFVITLNMGASLLEDMICELEMILLQGDYHLPHEPLDLRSQISSLRETMKEDWKALTREEKRTVLAKYPKHLLRAKKLYQSSRQYVWPPPPGGATPWPKGGGPHGGGPGVGPRNGPSNGGNGGNGNGRNGSGGTTPGKGGDGPQNKGPTVGPRTDRRIHPLMKKALHVAACHEVAPPPAASQGGVTPRGGIRIGGGTPLVGPRIPPPLKVPKFTVPKLKTPKVRTRSGGGKGSGGGSCVSPKMNAIFTLVPLGGPIRWPWEEDDEDDRY